MIIVTGASGKLGHHVVRGLVKKVNASQVVGTVRDPEKAQELKSLGVTVRRADYSRPETLAAAFAGAEKLLLISSNELEHRMPQHHAVINAAKKARVQLLAYTSILRADTSTIGLAADHKATESAIRAAGLPYVFLRNGWYFENYTEALAPALQHGAILGSANGGRIAAATRADYAGAAIAALTQPGMANRIFELAGDSGFTMDEFAAEVSRQSGKTVAYKNLPPQEYAKALLGFGLPGPVADMLADAEAAVARGELDSTSRDLHDLLGRPTTTLAAAVAQALQG